jgi:8-oxo-dGTP diphosphatase
LHPPPEERLASHKLVNVVAAVVEREDGRVLITQRLPGAVFPLYWEFPGGKVEPGEDDATALRREMREELDADVEVGTLVARKRHEYSDFDIDFRVYRCRLLAPTLACLHCADLRWVTAAEMATHRFPPADEDAIAVLVREFEGRGG